MKILLLGGNGLIGSRVGSRLRDHHEVYSPSSSSLNLTNQDMIESLPDDYEAIVHCAQYRNYSRPKFSQLEINELRAINALSLSHLIKNRKKVKMIVYMSTGGLYQPDQRLLNESSQIYNSSDCNPYFSSKLLAENILGVAPKNIAVSILRLFTVFGREANLDSLMPRMHRALLNGDTINIASSGGDILRPTHVGDVAHCVERVIRQKTTGIFNVGGPEVLNFQEILARFSSHYGLKVRIRETGERPKILAPDNLALESKLYSPKYAFRGNWQV